MSLRAAPQGTRPPSIRMDNPPDGWRSVAGEHRYSLATTLIRSSAAVADRVTRREILRRGGELGLLVGLQLTGLLWKAGPAAAVDPSCGCNCDDASGELPGPCGPSPLCNNSAVCNSNGNCALSVTGVRRRINASTNSWPGTSCGCDTCTNCWTENCCSQFNHVYRCCDCCTNGAGQPRCTGCDKHRCICRSIVLSAPCI